MKSIVSLPVILIALLSVIMEGTVNVESAQSYRVGKSHQGRVGLMKKQSESKPVRAAPSPFDILRKDDQFKGCIDPSEPFQCPQSEKCIALQFICDGNPGDCPGNTDENEETCIAAKRPAKENIEKFLIAEYTLHGSKLIAFIFGEKMSKRIEENDVFWFDALASALSVSKNFRSFAEKIRMSPDDLAHFRNVIETIHDGRLEEIPMFAQESVTQGLASLIEKLYGSGFMDS